jgi:hypothetical protein
MPFPVGQPIPIRYFHGITGATVLARVVDESDGVFGAELTLTENAAMLAAGYDGWYESTFTPDAEGHWKVAIKVGGTRYGVIHYEVGRDTSPPLSYRGTCDSGMGASNVTIVSEDIAGYGNDFFNTDWVMLIVQNDNAHGVAPEGQIRDITDYVSATGTFTVTAFGANVEATDKIIVARREYFTIDGIALQTTPITNSLGYRLSQYIASGDGDWAGGTPLPSNQSLYDQHIVAVADAVANAVMSDVLGNKADAPVWLVDAVSSIMGYAKATVAAQGISYKGMCDAGMAPSSVTNWRVWGMTSLTRIGSWRLS